MVVAYGLDYERSRICTRKLPSFRATRLTSRRIASCSAQQISLGSPRTVGLGLLIFGGWNFVLWGIFFRVTVGLHATWLVNSATHMWGSKRFPTRDDSRNNWWVALLTGGEGWHNNHHAHPGFGSPWTGVV